MVYTESKEAIKSIIETGKLMYEKGFVAANDGNISVRISENRIWITPSGVSKGFLEEEMLLLVDLDGNIVFGEFPPTSEMKMHIRLYKENPEILAVVHAHPPFATAFAVSGEALDLPILSEAILQLGEVPVAEYQTPGTQGVADSVAPFAKTHVSILLANHGALCWGKDIKTAWWRMEVTEQLAKITMLNTFIIKKTSYLTDIEIEELILQREKFGIETKACPKH